MNTKNIFQLIYARDIDYANNRKINKNDFYKCGAFLADQNLIKKISKSGDIKSIPENCCSIYGFNFSHDGSTAVASHTNRSISVLNVSKMIKIGVIKNSIRTIWTMAFHPIDRNIIATGSLGGQVSIYIKYEFFRSRNENIPTAVSSICFHPKYHFVLYSLKNKIIVWDWERNLVLYEFLSHPLSTIRYIKFTPYTQYLVTGISKVNIQQFEFVEVRTIYKQIHFIFTLINNILFDLEDFMFQNQSPSFLYKWKTLFNKLLLLKQSIENENTCKEIYKEEMIYDMNSSIQMIIQRLEKVFKQYHKGCRDNRQYDNKYIDLFTKIQSKYYNNKVNLKAIAYLLADLEDYVKQLLKMDLHYFGLIDQNDIIRSLNRDSLKFNTSPYVLQVWEFEKRLNLINLKNGWHNVISSCYIHNDSSVSLSKCGSMLALYKKYENLSLINIHSLDKINFGDLLYSFPTGDLIISLSFSPSSKFLLVGVRLSKHFAIILKLNSNQTMEKVYEHESNEIINCIAWAPTPGDGIFVGYNSGR